MLILNTIDDILYSNPQLLKDHLKTARLLYGRQPFVATTAHDYNTINHLLPYWQQFIDYLVTDDGSVVFSQQGQLVYVCKLEQRLVRQLQSLVCDRAQPISYSPYRHSISLMLGEITTKLRFQFRSEQQLHNCHERIMNHDWPIVVSSHLENPPKTSEFCGYLDIVPATRNRQQAIDELIQSENLHPKAVKVINDASLK